ncbi:hypothetical protein N5915_04430 [Arcobacter lacus]|uniref:Cyanophage baseplate Pam3 plug gp18 domain-containing protein n=1 Tax=Arcobacter lacus TaxID=1912876 RepID=A0ABX5JKU7_9BACT|nr:MULTISPECIES: hypothetical protein [Arcobacteraceae]MCG3684089.1 hypothetical protein [Aliarcobacter butzleri]MCT7551992.1 hypothetical protein [Aliarcobacter butzleri]MCT7908798.1 hypothetical protein [Arcobacter lacus]PUE66759.1 hypothetical protein B0175_05175 [Arcobacter lacus]RZV13641.1 hypothetical protein D3M61_07100 [Aliarcobacter butzleri]
MLKINIDPNPNQSFNIPYENDIAYIELSFRNQSWYMNITYGDKTINGIRLSSRVLLLKNNLPFELFIDDKGLNLDPFDLNSFSDNFFDFYLLERDEIADIRGYDVR